MAGSYPYAVGRIRVQETHLIDRARWNRLYEADEAEGMKLLIEAGYGTDSAEDGSLDAMIDAELLKTRQFINEITPDKALTDLLLLPVDVHNIKTLLKGMIQRVEVDDLLLEGGATDLEVLKQAMTHGDYTLLPLCFRETLKKLEDTEDPRVISAEIDRAAYQGIQEILKKHRDPLLELYFQAKIDFTNILTILRANVLKWETYRIRPFLLEGGELDEKQLLDALGVPMEQLARLLAHGRHSVTIRSILEKYAQDGNLTEVEQQLDNVAFAIIHDARGDSFGIGPVANYYLTRQAEGRALRVLFAGKRSGVKIPLNELGIVV